MINTLYLPELREMLEQNNAEELREFCTALHPASIAEFMEGLTAGEAWAVLRHAPPSLTPEIVCFFDHRRQAEIIETQDRQEMASLLADLPPDDRVDVLEYVSPEAVAELLKLIPADERKDILRLQAYPEGTAGAIMTTDFAMLSESLTVAQALDELGRQAQELETIYYLYVVDDRGFLRGVVSARQLVSAMRNREARLGDLMETDIAKVNVMDDQEDVIQKVAQYDLLAIPVVDDAGRMVGIITHDDVIDVIVEEATEDAQRIAAVHPLEESYMNTHVVTLSYKRGLWLIILFFAALLTAGALSHYEQGLERWHWLVWFIPLIISTGGNSGSQSATLIITAMATGDVRPVDWLRVTARELLMGVMLGLGLGAIGYFAACFAVSPGEAVVIPVTVLLVVISGTFLGATLPLLFQKLGWDPALMSNPFVAGIIDILGIVIYMNVAMLWL